MIVLLFCCLNLLKRISQQSKMHSATSHKFFFWVIHGHELHFNALPAIMTAIIIATVFVIHSLLCIQVPLFFPCLLLIIIEGRWNLWLNSFNIHAISTSFIIYGLLEKSRQLTPLNHYLMKDGAYSLTSDKPVILLLPNWEVWPKSRNLSSLVAAWASPSPWCDVRLPLPSSSQIMESRHWIYDGMEGSVTVDVELNTGSIKLNMKVTDAKGGKNCLHLLTFCSQWISKRSCSLMLL